MREAPQVAAHVLQGPSDPTQPWVGKGGGKRVPERLGWLPRPAPPVTPQGVPAPQRRPCSLPTSPSCVSAPFHTIAGLR